MPLNEEAPCMALWPQGLTNATMAQRLVTSGRLQPRPRGGAYPRRQAQERPRAAHAPSTIFS
jgi:hypothetical protein